MKELLFILAIMAVLFGITAIRYRRQIVAAIEFYKLIRHAKESMTPLEKDRLSRDNAEGIQLIKCSRCGKWIPQTAAAGDVRDPFCVDACIKL